MSTFSGDIGPEEEDGGGWGGLVPTKAEREAEHRLDRLRTMAYAAGRADEREESARLLEALRLIAGTDPVDAALDPQRAVRVASAALLAYEGTDSGGTGEKT